jgi:hypothetical protein
MRERRIAGGIEMEGEYEINEKKANERTIIK